MKAAQQMLQPGKEVRPKPAKETKPAPKRFGVIEGGERANHVLAGPLPKRRDGEKLPSSLQEQLAPLVGARAAGEARIHDDKGAAALALAHDAQAVTIGEHVYFAQGGYRPGTEAGDALVAHEVAHVAQAQRGLLHGPALKSTKGSDGGPLEAAADRVAKDLDAEKKKKPAKAKQAAPEKKEDLPAEPQQPAAAEAAQKTAEAPVEKKAAAGPALPKGLPVMPQPSMELSKAEQKRVSSVQGRAAAGAKATKTAPPAKENVAVAQASVQVPQKESDARAAQDVVSGLAELPPPSPEIVQLCERIKKLIKEKRPADQEGVIDTRPQEVAKEAGGTVEGDVQQNVDDAKSAYGTIDQKPAGAAPDPAKPAEALPTHVDAPAVDAKAAVPDPVPAGETSLDADREKMDKQAQGAGIETAPAQLVKEGPIAEAHGAKGEMHDLAKKGPEEVRKEQQAAIAKADGDMLALQMKAAAALKEARTAHVHGVASQQGTAKGTEEEQRAALSKNAEDIFKSAQNRVQALLEPVQRVAMAEWTAGLPLVSSKFEADLKLVKDAVDERHSGISGWFVGKWDNWKGLPPEFMAAYDRAEANFGDGICELITGISRDVNRVIEEAKGIIQTARDDIHHLFTDNLPKGLAKWAAEQEKGFGKKLDALSDSVDKARNDFNKELIENAGNAVQAAREKIQKLREEGGGLWGRFLNALHKFLDDPIKFIIEGILSLLSIPPASFWAVVRKIQKVAKDIADDPIKFGKNLLSGIGKGFDQFFDRIGKHLAQGLVEWLLSGLKKEGISIEIPKEITLQSTITFFLQLLGISWMSIRKLLVEQLDEKSVAQMEQAAGIISTLKTKGIGGILEDIKTMLDPKTILGAIIDAAVNFVTQKIIESVVVKVALMFVPGGAILEALKAIYNILKWIFENAAKLFHFIEAVVDSMAAVIAGNLSGVANTIEKALAMLVAPVIDFLAEFFSLGALPGKVAKAVLSLQNWVQGVMRRVIAWLVGISKPLFAKLGIKTKDDKEKDKDKEKKKPGSDQVGERVAFSGGGESHAIYIATSGATATVMIASTPTPLENWLGQAEKKTAALPAGKEKDRAQGLIAKARDLLSKTDKEADQVAQAHQAAQSASAAAPAADAKEEAKDEAVKSDEHQLSTALADLADLLGLDNKPEKLEAQAVNLPREKETPKLIASLAKAVSTAFNARPEPDPKELVKELIAKHGAKFDPSQKTLTLRSADASAMAATETLEAMSQSAAKDSGVSRVEFAKSGDRFELHGHVGGLKTKLAYGSIPAALDDKTVGDIADDRHLVLFKAWKDQVVKSPFKYNKEDTQLAWFDFAIDTHAEIAAAGSAALYRHVVDKHIDTKERLAEEIASGGTARELFQVTSGGKVAAEVKDKGTQRLKTVIDDQEARDKIEARIEKYVKYSENTQLGHIDTPGADSLHTEFRPEDISIKDNIVTYTTKTGQSFKATLVTANGPTESIEGKNLSQKSQGGPQTRGETEDSTWYVPGLQLNRSHLIADEFKGPGYTSSGNVISVSANYNQKTMRDAEKRIGAGLKASKAISFDMKVTVRWGDEVQDELSKAVLGAPWYAKDDDTAEAKDERDKLLATVKGLKRCKAVSYRPVVVKTEPGGSTGGFDDDIGEDVDLLKNLDLKGKKK